MCDYKILSYTNLKGKVMSRKVKIGTEIKLEVPSETTETQLTISTGSTSEAFYFDGIKPKR